ncbi:MAG: insulinase family protein, partial [Tidjanibacter sp.]|nr:insulinase family protein [Tidjanibacter sp.]
RYLNQPYGDQWMLLRGEAYQKSHYRWATIGLSPDHIRAASLDEVRAFYDRFYQPSNAILSLSADIAEDEMIAMAEEWFGDIPSTPAPLFVPEAEPVQSAPRRLEVERAVPADQITIAIRMEHRNSRCHYLCDLLTDLMAGGESARFYQRLVKEQQIFSSTNAYITGEVDGGLFIAIGQLNPGVTIEEAEAAVWRELLLFATEPVGEKELEKVRNKFEANILFGELNVMNKAMNLSYYAMLGDMSLLNGEVAIYNSITPEEIMDFAQKFFRHDQSTTLVIRSKQ